ncbi:MAG: MarR family transcriptional regulator [Nocardioides sp.]|uniref:MarR family winged helix-turn-helix transcriptional regulator n=1 Tax=Nocardioides sp. TaxID=35761 RepID=UPI00326629CC
MTSVNESDVFEHDRPDHALALLADAFDLFRRDLEAEFATMAVPAFLDGVRGSQMRLLQLTPPAGLSATQLAVRAGMTKQALGELAASLEARGLYESVSHPTDRRLRIWRPTVLGREASETADRAVATVEHRWRRHLGAADWDALRDTLSRARAR